MRVISALVAAAVAAQIALAQTYMCPTYLRSAHTFNPAAGTMPALDVYVNDKLVNNGVTFRTVTSYAPITAGRVVVGVRTAGAAATTPFLANATFTAAPGGYYTVGFTGPLAGPAGQVVNNRPPIVNEDIRRVPNPGRFSGLWYRWSETPVAVDFRVLNGNPDPTTLNVTADAERISQLAPKTIIPYGELPAGTYSFYPTLVGNNNPLFNPVSNQYVAVANLQTQAGAQYDFFATGDSLLASHTNNLFVSSTQVTTQYDAVSGCTIIPNGGATPVPYKSGAVQAAASFVMLALAGASAWKLLQVYWVHGRAGHFKFDGYGS